MSENIEIDTTILDSTQIQELLPHRYPFLLIDKIVQYEDNVRIVGIKNVTINEQFFQGHFPSRPVMPGVLILEAIAQTAAILAMKSTDGVAKGKYVFLAGADNFRWKKQVLPGDTLRIEVVSVRKRRPLWIMEGKAYVGNKLVTQGTVSAAEAF